MHIFFHSHDDVGWKETAEWYYSHWIEPELDTVMPILLKDPKKNYIYSEIYYFER